MEERAERILRNTLGITFLVIGYMIWKAPLAWGGYIQEWALSLMVLPLVTAMKISAVVDMAIGALFLLNRWTFYAAAVASAHLAVILVTAGVNDVTIRDVGLLGATLALALLSYKKR